MSPYWILSDFIGAKDDAGGGDNWSYKMCKVSVKLSPPAYQHPQLFAGLKPFLSPNQQCHSTEGKCIKRFCLTNKNLCQPTQKCLLTFGQLYQAIVKAATGNAKLLTDTSADKIL